MKGFFERLKQRKLVQWVLAYAAGAWALLQVLEMATGSYGLPALVMRVAFSVIALGFVVTLLLAWYHGERGEQKVSSTELILIALVLVVGGALVWRSNLRVPATTLTPTTTAAVADKAVENAAIPAKSIAVLPFENLSADKDNAYFATGMQDEILTRLAGIHDLKVISRTSTEQYASHPPNLKIVAEQLGVATVLEGSVQKADGKVRINLQLIDAHSDSHLWAQNYDRDLKDVFAVQSDVAEKVADALKAQLLPAESARIASVPTQNQQAYDLFLKAEYLTNQIEAATAKDPAEAVRKATGLYESAIAADPNFALAYARLSYLKSMAYFSGQDPSPQAIDAAQAAATQALALQPNLPQAHLAMGYVHYWGHRDYAAALAEFATARASLPDANVIAAIAFVHRRQGNLVQAVSELEQASALDPRNTGLPGEIGNTLMILRRYPEAVAAFDRTLALGPDNIAALVNRATALQMRGDLEGASRSLANIPAHYDPLGAASLARFDLALAMRQPDAALAAIANTPTWLLNNQDHILIPAMLLRGQALARKGDTGPARTAFLAAQSLLERLPREQPGTQNNLADVYAGLGQTDAALAAARRAADLLPMSRDMVDGAFYLTRLAKIEAQVGQTDAALKHIEQLLAVPAGREVSAASLRTDPAWDPLRKDPRFQALLAAHLSDEKGAHP